MNKKLAVFALMGTTTLMLTGCSLGGVTPEQYAQQTQMLIQMQQDMKTLLSGMDELRAQNAAMSGALVALQGAMGLQTLIHGSADTPNTGEMNILGSDDPKDAVTPTVTDVYIPLPPSIAVGENTGTNDTGGSLDNLVATGTVSSGAVASGSVNTGKVDNSTGSTSTGSSTKTSLLEELKKASEKSSTGTKPTSPTTKTGDKK